MSCDTWAEIRERAASEEMLTIWLCLLTLFITMPR